jgi:two-component system sensor histidine kinase PfeS
VVKGIVLKPFKLRLFVKLYLTIALSSIVLIWLVMVVSDYAETRLSTIAKAHQITLLAYAQHASDILNDKVGSQKKLQIWVEKIQEKENTWLAIMKTEPQWLVGGYAPLVFEGETDFTIGRNMAYPIHLYYSHNPVMKVAIPNSQYNLLIQLPQRMRPGAYIKILNSAIKLGLPILLVALLSLLLYRHIIAPLQQLQKATQSMIKGDLDVSLAAKLTERKDELGELASSFNTMTERIRLLISRQRQLISDISHELRTPITRIKLVLANSDNNSAFKRVEQEVNSMQVLLEDTLTLSWLNNQDKKLLQESVDVSLLIDTIVDDANFEFSRQDITMNMPDSCVIHNSNHRALGQALENIVRNAMKYTPVGTPVVVCLSIVTENHEPHIKIEISDQGEGIEDMYLQEIFEPFFRVNKARDKNTEGYGLGLALSKRQIEVIRGSVVAKQNHPQGLTFLIVLPLT